MKRAAFLSFLAFALLAAGLALRDGKIAALSLPLISYLALGLLQFPDLPQLEVDTHLTQSSATEGSVIGVSVQVRNNGPSLTHLRIQDRLPTGLTVRDGTPSTLGSLAQGASHQLSYSVRSTRGLHSFDRVAFTASDPLGLFQREFHKPTTRSLLARPSLHRLRHVELRPLRTGVHAGLYRARRGGPGVEFHGLRPYVPGDARRWINWKASARHVDSLFINEFEQERAVEIGIILDARSRSNAVAGGRSSFSSSVQAAASLSDLFLAQANRVGLMIYGSHLDWTVPGYGRIHRERIMLALAGARAGRSRVFDRMKYLPTRLFPPQSQLIFISPVLREDVAFLRILRARRYPILVLSPDLISAEAELLEGETDLELAIKLARIEQTLITRRLAHIGIHRVVWDISKPLEQVIEIQVGRPRRWLRAVGAPAR
ncbi:MAG: DUF58 domain-containing protein [Anaerolineales bacterium]